MFIKSINANAKDIFLGTKGWDNWTRYERVEGQWKQTKGLRVDDGTHRAIVSILTSWKQKERRDNGKRT